MHLIAANLWTWIRYILIEESIMGDEIRHIFIRDASLKLKVNVTEKRFLMNELNISSVTANNNFF